MVFKTCGMMPPRLDVRETELHDLFKTPCLRKLGHEGICIFLMQNDEYAYTAHKTIYEKMSSGGTRKSLRITVHPIKSQSAKNLLAKEKPLH